MFWGRGKRSKETLKDRGFLAALRRLFNGGA